MSIKRRDKKGEKGWLDLPREPGSLEGREGRAEKVRDFRKAERSEAQSQLSARRRGKGGSRVRSSKKELLKKSKNEMTVLEKRASKCRN